MQMPTGVVMRRTADLVPYANNARTHTPEPKGQQIAASASTRYRASHLGEFLFYGSQKLAARKFRKPRESSTFGGRPR